MFVDGSASIAAVKHRNFCNEVSLFSRSFCRVFPVLFPTFSNLKFKASVEGEYKYSVRIPDNKGRIINEGLFKVKYLIKLSQYFGNLAKAVVKSHNKKDS